MSNLNNCKPGDFVALQTGWHTTGFYSGFPIQEKAIVEKVTAKEITVRGQRFLKRTGYKLGDGNYPSRRETRIKMWTPEVEAEITANNIAIAEDKKRQAYLRIIEPIKFRDLTTDQLASIATIIKEVK